MFDASSQIRIIESNLTTGHTGPTRHSLGYVKKVYPKCSLYIKEGILIEPAVVLFFRYGRSSKLRIESKLLNLALPYLTGTHNKSKLSQNKFHNFLTKIKLLNKNKNLSNKIGIPLTVVAAPHTNPQPIQNMPLLQQEALFESFKGNSFDLVIKALRFESVRPPMNFISTHKLISLSKILSLSRKSLHTTLKNLSADEKGEYLITYNKMHAFMSSYFSLNNKPPYSKDIIKGLQAFKLNQTTESTHKFLQCFIDNLFSTNNIPYLNLLVNNITLFPNITNTAYRILEAKRFLQNM